MSWPSIRLPNYPLQEKTLKRQYKDEFEAGYVVSRAAATRARKQFRLDWDVIPEADYQTLDAFFIANQGGTFSWTHPETSTVYTVRFVDDYIDFAIIPVNQRRGSLTLEEQ